MIDQELKIIFESDKAYLTESKSLRLEQVSLPGLVKSFKKPAYCVIKVLKYLEIEKRIYCEILSYNIGITDFDITQENLIQKLELIETITFRHIDTMKILAMAKEDMGSSFCVNTAHREFYRIPISHERVTENFKVSFNDVHFTNSGVYFEYSVKKYNQKIVLTISNPDIKEEFDAIKEYFSNVLKTKKIQVKAEIEIGFDKSTPISVQSPEIDKINKQLITDIKIKVVKQTTHQKSDTTKSIFTMDEYFDTYANKKIQAEAFYNNDTDFFEDIITISNAKHYKQLRYLSKIHSYKTMRLRIIHQPLSFLFLIEGKSHFYYIWETLNTNEATYIWHTEKNTQLLKDTLINIDSIINQIYTEGKTQYINQKEESFKRIYHDYTTADEGFKKWKEELNKTLV